MVTVTDRLTVCFPLSVGQAHDVQSQWGIINIIAILMNFRFRTKP